MLLLDLSHTSHTQALTGIQRVCRALYRELGDEAQAITWDPYAQQWRELNRAESLNLATTSPATKRGNVWPWATRLRGWGLRTWRRTTALPHHHALIVPELFSSAVATALPKLAVSGPRVALFHDAIALKLPELTPAKTVARFPAYLQELQQFDGIAAVSEDSAATLRDYWRWLGATRLPPVTTIPLGLDACKLIDYKPPIDEPPVILCVGSIEGRKNHLALLDACERLWSAGSRFSLRLIGLAQAQTGRAALGKIATLQAAGRPLRYDGVVDEVTLAAAYTACTFTVYPSIMEGFGLPVIESLQHGKPCICSAHGALGESARGGGCVRLDSVDAPALVDAMRHLLAHPAQIEALRLAARQRTFRTWRDYTRDLTSWVAGL